MLNISGLNDYFSERLERETALSLLILILSLTVIFNAYMKGIRFIYNKTFKIFIGVFTLFITLASISSLINPFNYEMTWGYRYYLPSLLIYLAGIYGFLFWVRNDSLLSAVNLLRFAFIINTCTVVISYFMDIDFLVVNEERASGVNLNANTAGYIGALALSFELFFLSHKKSRSSYFFIPIIIIGVFTTFSKAAFLMVLVIVTLYSLSLLKGITKTSNLVKLIGIASLIVAGAIILINSFGSLSKEQKSRIVQVGMLLQADINTNTTTNRSDLALVGWQKINDAPLLGNGFKEMSQMGTGGVHNQYLLLWGEGGILSMFAYIYLLMTYFRYSRNIPPDYRFLIRSILFCIAFFSLTNHNMYSSKSLMLIFAFIAVILNNFKYVRNIRSTRVGLTTKH